MQGLIGSYFQITFPRMRGIDQYKTTICIRKGSFATRHNSHIGHNSLSHIPHTVAIIIPEHHATEGIHRKNRKGYLPPICRIDPAFSPVVQQE